MTKKSTLPPSASRPTTTPAGRDTLKDSDIEGKIKTIDAPGNEVRSDISLKAARGHVLPVERRPSLGGISAGAIEDVASEYGSDAGNAETTGLAKYTDSEKAALSVFDHATSLVDSMVYSLSKESPDSTGTKHGHPCADAPEDHKVSTI